ncbi:DUF397 domain-containing protein [Streptomyces silvensis]|uniref:DUF397 domain-containing protein n=1 Tax=Streptomyces silvensis TaxID=1765722 RepID=UPI00099EA330|nr:DUF397 domain-containing protein [Streptomyces silvensis]
MNPDSGLAQPTLRWFKSSHSSNDGPECVEVAIPPIRATVHIRDSKNTSGPCLTVQGVAWAEFVGFAARR